MTPSYAVKKGARYRYYVSRPLITNDQSEGSAGLRIPAVEIEQLVTSRVRQWLLDTGSVLPGDLGAVPCFFNTAKACLARPGDRKALARVADDAQARPP